MLNWELVCIMGSGMPLTELARDVILMEAVRMIRDHRRRGRIKSDDIEGRLATEFEDGILGSFVGKKFNAEVETDFGKSKATFLIDEDTTEEILKSGVWIRLNAAHARKAQMN